MKIKFLLSFINFLFLFYIFSLSSITFLVNSDMHVGNDECPNYHFKKNQLSEMERYSDKLDCVIFVGDLTDNGKDEEFAIFQEEWVKIFSDKGIEVFLCRGNHDEDPFFNHKVLNENVPEKYSINLQGIRFICCGEYPNKIKWLKNELSKTGTKTPIIIFFHYNIVGVYSSWWSQEQKDEFDNSIAEFFNVIKNYNIKSVFTGHWHKSYTYLWKNSIPVIGVGGEYFAIVEFDKEFKIIFKNKDGKVKTWKDLEYK